MRVQSCAACARAHAHVRGHQRASAEKHRRSDAQAFGASLLPKDSANHTRGHHVPPVCGARAQG
eukprot:478707-Alexandrium_andersonii.AAC.1